MRAPVLPTLAVALTLALSGCGGDSDGGTGGSTQRVDVAAGDTTCTLSETSFAAGKIALDVTNEGKDVTEVYVYGKGGSGKFDKVVGEVENIAPGTSRDFEVDVTEGEYEVACKPGQKGDGIRTEIEVSGEGGSSEAAYDREVEVSATDFAFSGLAGLAVKTGEKIEFKLSNKGAATHNLTVLAADGTEVGKVADVAPGAEGEAIIAFAKAGTYTYKCTIGTHAEQGMEGTFTVS